MLASCKILCPQPIDALRPRDPRADSTVDEGRAKAFTRRGCVPRAARRRFAGHEYFASVAGGQLFPATYRLHMEAQREDEGAFAAIADERRVIL
jgi:hypothetical protein